MTDPGKVEDHVYQLYLAINDIAKAMSPHTNDICERHPTRILSDYL